MRQFLNNLAEIAGQMLVHSIGLLKRRKASDSHSTTPSDHSRDPSGVSSGFQSDAPGEDVAPSTATWSVSERSAPGVNQPRFRVSKPLLVVAVLVVMTALAAVGWKLLVVRNGGVGVVAQEGVHVLDLSPFNDAMQKAARGVLADEALGSVRHTLGDGELQAQLLRSLQRRNVYSQTLAFPAADESTGEPAQESPAREGLRLADEVDKANQANQAGNADELLPLLLNAQFQEVHDMLFVGQFSLAQAQLVHLGRTIEGAPLPEDMQRARAFELDALRLRLELVRSGKPPATMVNQLREHLDAQRGNDKPTASLMLAHLAMMEAHNLAGDVTAARERLASLQKWAQTKEGRDVVQADALSLKARWAEVLLSLGQFKEARQLIPGVIPGSESPESCHQVLEALMVSTELAINEGLPALARSQLSLIEACLGAKGGPDHFLNARYENSRGLLLLMEERPDEALVAFESAEKRWRLGLGDRHHLIASAMNNIGAAYRMAGNEQKAVDAYETSRVLWLESVGAEHPAMATYFNNKAELHLREGNLPGAHEMLDQARSLRRSAYGDEHPWTAVVTSNDGELAAMENRLDEALALHGAALRTRQTTLGDRHIDTAMSWNNLGAVQFKAGELRPALGSFSKALDVNSAMLGEGNPRTLTSLANLASAHLALEELPEAERALARLVELETGSGQKARASLPLVMRRLAQVQRMRDDVDAAIQTYSVALDYLAGLDERSKQAELARSLLAEAQQLLQSAQRMNEAKSLAARHAWVKESRS